MNIEKFNQHMLKLINTLRARGIDGNKYRPILLEFDKLLDRKLPHDEFDVLSKLIQSMSIQLDLKHMKFHKEGGKDERGNAITN